MRHADPHAPIAYRERTRFFANPLIKALCIMEPMLMTGIAIAVLLSPTGGPVLAIIIFLTCGLLIPFSIGSVTLDVRLEREHLRLRFFPFPGRDIPLDRITRADVVPYRFLAESSGWGWRLCPKYHRAYTVTGDRAVHVVWGERKNEQCAIGSKDAETLADQIRAAAKIETETKLDSETKSQ